MKASHGPAGEGSWESWLRSIEPRSGPASEAWAVAGRYAESALWLERARALVARAEWPEARPWLLTALESAASISRPYPATVSRHLIGLLALAGLDPDARALEAMVRLVRSALAPASGRAARGLKVGSRALRFLAEKPGLEPVRALSLLKAQVKGARLVELVEDALREAATRRGASPEDLEELCVPDFGFEGGVFRFRRGGWEAVVDLRERTRAEVRWVAPSGETSARLPKAIREGFPDDVSRLRALAKEATETLRSVRERIERWPLRDRKLPFGAWRERYWRHALVCTLTERLIWRFGEGAGSFDAMPRGAALRTADGEGVPPELVDDEIPVTLWHPVEEDAPRVAAWRRWIVEREIVQPFKQAHREVYPLLPEDYRGGAFSNRFAGHILAASRVAAVARARGWRCAMPSVQSPGAFSGCRFTVPGSEWTAEWRLEGVRIAGERSLGDRGQFLTVESAELRFRMGDRPREIWTVPAVLRSEVMRDVDLFVSVASIGADPAWYRRGPETIRAYWEHFAAGSDAARLAERRDLIAALLPRLGLRDRMRVSERYLLVRGELGEYRIHLGNGHVQVSPNGPYLFLPVETSRTRLEPYVPFEDDPMIGEILRKALFLAEDARTFPRVGEGPVSDGPLA